MAKWVLSENDANIELMSEILKINKITSYIIANRGIRSKNSAKKFLCPDIKFLNDIDDMKDCQKSIELINSSKQKFEKIAIYGDYDVGATRF